MKLMVIGYKVVTMGVSRPGYKCSANSRSHSQETFVPPVVLKVAGTLISPYFKNLDSPEVGSLLSLRLHVLISCTFRRVKPGGGIHRCCCQQTRNSPSNSNNRDRIT